MQIFRFVQHRTSFLIYLREEFIMFQFIFNEIHFKWNSFGRNKRFRSLSIRVNLFFFRNFNKNKSNFLDLSPLRVQPWKVEKTCGVDLLNHYAFDHSIECLSNDRILNCNQLLCGCRYVFRVKFNQTNIQKLCSQTSDCDFVFNDPNLTTIQFQTRKEIKFLIEKLNYDFV